VKGNSLASITGGKSEGFLSGKKGGRGEIKQNSQDEGTNDKSSVRDRQHVTRLRSGNMVAY
jgi:hypothetical protein